MALRIGFAQEIITPELGVPLCGYFVPRPNTGAYDDLYVRALVIEGNDGERCAIVSADLCFLSLELIDRCRCAIKNIGIDYHGKIIFSATHTHTAPYPAEFFGDPADETYLAHFAMKCALAIKRADAGLAGCTLATANAYCDTLAFNRRYWMKDGTVITNPADDADDTDGNVNNDTDTEANPVKKGKALPWIIGGIVLLGGAAAAVYFLVIKKKEA